MTGLAVSVRPTWSANWLSGRACRWCAAILVLGLALNAVSLVPHGAAFPSRHTAAPPSHANSPLNGVEGQASVSAEALQGAPAVSPRRPARSSPGTSAVATGRMLPPTIAARLATNPDVDYGVAALGAGELQAANPAQGFTSRFADDGVHFAWGDGAAWSLRSLALIAGNATLALDATAPARREGRVEYRHDGLTEWYANGPAGLEQGFTVTAPPAGESRFALALSIDGAPPQMAADGTVHIGDARYGGLTVTDAAGTKLPAQLTAEGSTIHINVDATSARWPVTVDPTLAASDDSAHDGFGTSVAVATFAGTTTIVVGAPFKQVDPSTGTTGAVYVFTGSGGSYPSQARLTSTGAHFLGLNVAVTANGTGTTVFASGRPGPVHVFTGSGAAFAERSTLSTPANIGSLAATTNGTTSTLAVGVPSYNGTGAAFLFNGSGGSYNQTATLSPSDTNASNDYGFSVAIAYDPSTGQNTVVMGSPNRTVNGQASTGGAGAFIGSGGSYTPFNVVLQPTNPIPGQRFGASVAVTILNNANSGYFNAIAIGAPNTPLNTNDGAVALAGAAYVETGSGTIIGNYAEREVTDSFGPLDSEYFGTAVAIAPASGEYLMAVGAPERNYSAAQNPNNPPFDSDTASQDNVIFVDGSNNDAEYFMPEDNGATNDSYGSSLAMAAAPNGDIATVAGAPAANAPNNGAANAGAVYTTTNNLPVGLQPASIDSLGDNGRAIAGASGQFGNLPNIFDIGVSVQNGSYADVPNTGVTFTVQPNGGAYAVFNRSDPNSTTTDVQTDNYGEADVVLYPSATAGSFTVTATVDSNPGIQTTFNLRIVPQAPVPQINRLDDPHWAGLLPALVPASSPDTILLQVRGQGFTPQTQIVFPNNVTAQPYWADSTWIQWQAPANFFTLTGGTYGYLPVFVRTPSDPGLNDGGSSNTINLLIYDPAAASAGDSGSFIGNQTIYIENGDTVVPPPVLVQQGGQPAPGVGGQGNDLVAAKAGELISQDGSTLISQDGSTLISQDGSTVVSNDGSTVVSNDGSTVISNDGSTLISQDGGGVFAQQGTGLVGNSGGTSVRTPAASARDGKSHVTANNAALTGNAYGFTDGNGLYIAPAVTSNGIGGTYTRTIAIKGIAQPFTVTFVNLNPRDGHPAAITSLSRTSANAGDPGFTLTVNGTGFVKGSIVSFAGVQLPTTALSSTKLTTAVPAVLLNYIGKFNVKVVNPDPQGGVSPPVSFTISGPSLTVSPSSGFANGTTGTAYPTQQFSASGGSAHYVFAVSAGTIPPGLQVTQSGKLMGTPTQGGSFTFTVGTYDTHFIGASGSRQYTIVISGPTIAVASAVSGPFKVGQSVQLHATQTNPDGSTQDVTSQGTWTSSNPAIVKVSNAADAGKPTPGMAIALSPGSVTVTVTLNGVTSQPFTVAVGSGTAVGVAPQPAPSGRVNGQTTGNPPPVAAPIPRSG